MLSEKLDVVDGAVRLIQAMASPIAVSSPASLVLEVCDVAVHPNLEASGTIESYCIQNYHEPHQ